MFLSYFSNQPYVAFDEALPLVIDELDHPARERGDAAVLFSNRHFDAPTAAAFYDTRLAEYRFAEEVGFDGIMTNEHHGTPSCMSPRTNIVATAIAANTSRVRLLVLG